MKKLKLREIWGLAEGPAVGKWPSQDLSLALAKARGWCSLDPTKPSATLRVFSETQVTVDTHLRAYVKTHRLYNRQL